MEQDIQPNVSPMKTAITYGLYMGLGVIIFSLIMYMLGMPLDSKVHYIQYAIYIAAIWFGIQHHRENDLAGFISYSRALGCGTLISAVGGILSAIYTFIQLKFIDPEMISKIMAMQEKKMLDKGMAPDQVEQAIKMSASFMTPAMMATTIVPVAIFSGFIISLLLASVLKKEKPMFDSH
ncbi:DUF4199 domain-containing protein [Solitalea koreensis]|uniref:DUF4199 domain-containing protein n=1 Tax=Solitalea koreensis TaxID=543615 RepID=A0A521BK16_9SPHI|nr:DUF4199 domain-containing protein [Solitalea koreensis]SMO47439.1 Protein of unknown function [Solitalea koreensis]